jgi:hypothetical protein
MRWENSALGHVLRGDVMGERMVNSGKMEFKCYSLKKK